MNEEKETTQVPNYDKEEMKMPEGSAMPDSQPESSVASGPVIFALAIVLLAILGGLYYWFSTLNTPPVEVIPTPIERPSVEENNEPESTTAEAQTDTLDVVSTSDEINAIEADLEGTSLDALDAELEAIDAELESII